MDGRKGLFVGLPASCPPLAHGTNRLMIKIIIFTEKLAQNLAFKV
tara:strand:+ start:295 stop:429 length:135 start_codon:yes stop_codon:yes gene_type:complete